MTQSESFAVNLTLTGAEIRPALKSFTPVTIFSNRGNIDCRLYSNAPSPYAVLWLTSAVGGWTSPAKNLYPRVAKLLTTKGVSSLRLSYRQPGNLQECVLDAMAGITFLQHRGFEKVAIIGHAFGGAVAIQTAKAMSSVRCVVTLATQTMGTAAIATLRSDCAILLIHGEEDRVLPATCSESLFARAHEPKRLLLVKEAGHNLDEASNEVYLAISDWLNKNLVGL